MAFGDVAGLLEPLIVTAEGMGGVFVPIGRVLLGLAVMLAVLYAVYDWWMGEVNGALARLVRAGLILTIPLYLLSGNNWATDTKVLTKFFASDLTAPVLAAGGSASGPEAIRNTITKISTSMFPNTRAKEGQEQSSFEQTWKFIVGQKSVGGAIFSAMTEAFFELLLFIISVVLVIALVVALYGPLLALHIGIVFGPLLLAWMPFGPMAHLTRNWLQFILSQGFALVVGITMAIIASNSIEAYTNSMLMMGAEAGLPWFEELGAKIGGFMASSAVILFVAWMLFKADDIAAAMIGGGGAGTGGVGAVILNKIAPKSAPQGGKGGGGKGE